MTGFELHFVDSLEQFYAFKHLRGLVEVRPREQCLLFALLFALAFLSHGRCSKRRAQFEFINGETQMSYVEAHCTYH